MPVRPRGTCDRCDCGIIEEGWKTGGRHPLRYGHGFTDVSVDGRLVVAMNLCRMYGAIMERLGSKSVLSGERGAEAGYTLSGGKHV